MWGTIVNRDGVVCAVAFTGNNRGAQWPGSRVISAQKANTANAFSLDPSAGSGGNGSALALSTANLFSAVQPGGRLFDLQLSNPVDTAVAYKRPSTRYGTSNDPMVAEKIGGVNVFGGGLALYDSKPQDHWCRRRQWRHLLCRPLHRAAHTAQYQPGPPPRSNRRRVRRRKPTRQHHFRFHSKCCRRHWRRRWRIWASTMLWTCQEITMSDRGRIA